MKKLFIIGNWKSNKTGPETIEWLQKLFDLKLQIPAEKTVILCPSFTLLPVVKAFFQKYQLPLKVGSQNISPYGRGAYTGEVNGEQLKEYADYAIIGHSERRNNFAETDEVLNEKVRMALQFGLTPIYCIQNEKTIIPDGVNIVAYEPPNAISTSGPDAKAASPQDAQRVANLIKKSRSNMTMIYGGSVNESNVHEFTGMDTIDGVLPGAASLDPIRFAAIIKNA